MARQVVIEVTETFKRTYQALPDAIQKKVKKQLTLLRENPKHPSLKIHKLNDEWEFYVDIHYRCIFERSGHVHTLLVVGTHKIVDRH
jgi:mRNA-degrading endonuclease RelE of RelBE toxin-antitoxin system